MVHVNNMLRGGVLILFNKIKAVLSNEKGSTFIESGLWIALVVLVMAGAGVALANTMNGKFTQIGSTVGGVDVPNP
jgi:Flp pilus assembly pilin Flp